VVDAGFVIFFIVAIVKREVRPERTKNIFPNQSMRFSKNDTLSSIY